MWNFRLEVEYLFNLHRFTLISFLWQISLYAIIIIYKSPNLQYQVTTYFGRRRRRIFSTVEMFCSFKTHLKVNCTRLVFVQNMPPSISFCPEDQGKTKVKDTIHKQYIALESLWRHFLLQCFLARITIQTDLYLVWWPFGTLFCMQSLHSW